LLSGQWSRAGIIFGRLFIIKMNTSQDGEDRIDVSEGAAADKSKEGRLSPRSKASLYALGILLAMKKNTSQDKLGEDDVFEHAGAAGKGMLGTAMRTQPDHHSIPRLLDHVRGITGIIATSLTLLLTSLWNNPGPLFQNSNVRPTVQPSADMSRRPKQGRIFPRSRESVQALGFLAILTLQACVYWGRLAPMLVRHTDKRAKSDLLKRYQVEGAHNSSAALAEVAHKSSAALKDKATAVISNTHNVLEFEVQLSELPLRPNRRGSFKVLVHPEWAPLGSKRLLELFKLGFYDQTRFFRVVKNADDEANLVQWGISGDPATSAKWCAPRPPAAPAQAGFLELGSEPSVHGLTAQRIRDASQAHEDHPR